MYASKDFSSGNDMHKNLLLTAASIASLLPGFALAQSGSIVVMRKTIEPQSGAIATPWLPDKERRYGWNVRKGDVPPSCGSVSVPQAVTCVDDLGNVSKDAFCRDPRPSSTIEYVDHRSCTYAWSTDGWSDWTSTCSDAAQRGRAIHCVRSDGQRVQSGCSEADRPSSSETSARYEGCSYSWHAYGWGPYDSYCSDAAQRTRETACQRSDGAIVDKALCGGGAPATSETSSVLEGCRFYWKIDSWVEPSPTCGPAIKTALASCHRSAQDGRSDTTVPDEQCASAPKPSMTEGFNDTRACSYSWMQDRWSDWSSSCSDTATRTKTAYCVKSDGSTVHDSLCDAKTKPAPISETSGQYAGCTARWAFFFVSPATGVNDTCFNGTVRYSAYPECADSSNKRVASSVCEKNVAIKKPANVSGVASCRTYNVFQGAPYGYNGYGSNGKSTPVKSYPGKLTETEVMEKAIEQCVNNASENTYYQAYCQFAQANYYPKVNRTYVIAGIYLDPGDKRIEPFPSDQSGVVTIGTAKWQGISRMMELKASDASFALNGWSTGTVTLNRDYSFTMTYVAK